MKPILITNTKELHACIQRLVAQSDESLQKDLGDFEDIHAEVRQKYKTPDSNRFCVEAIWADALYIPEHLKIVAHREIERRKVNGPPLEFVNY